MIHKYGTDGLAPICEDLLRQGFKFNTDQYKLNYLKAYRTFKHQIVFDSQLHVQKHLILPSETYDLSYVGNLIPNTQLAMDMAKGLVNPDTQEVYPPFQTEK